MWRRQAWLLLWSASAAFIARQVEKSPAGPRAALCGGQHRQGQNTIM
jgi:hypothetical protein